MRTILVTGAAGFIGSNFVRMLRARNEDVRLIAFDKLTYAGNLATLADLIDDRHVIYFSGPLSKGIEFYGDPKAQARWIGVLVDLVAELGIDGVNVDVESLPSELVTDYGAFVGRLRTALRDRSPKAEVSVATQSNELGASMAAAAAAAGADRIFLMGYDYRWPGSEPGASAPIDRMDGQPCSCGAVGSGNEAANHSRTAGEKPASTGC